MSSQARTTTARDPLGAMRKTALVAGLLYLATFLSSIPAVFLQGPVFNDPTSHSGLETLAAIRPELHDLAAAPRVIRLEWICRGDLGRALQVRSADEQIG